MRCNASGFFFVPAVGSQRRTGGRRLCAMQERSAGSKPRVLRAVAIAAAVAAVEVSAQPSNDRTLAARAAAYGTQFERAVGASDRVLRAWLAHADPETLLLPDRPLPDRARRVYTPHNSGADLYPYLILTAHLTDPALYRGRMLEMLRSEVRHTTVQRSIPADLNLGDRTLGRASFFGAAEYSKDGLIAVTEYLGRTPWFYRMVDMIGDAMSDAPVAS